MAKSGNFSESLAGSVKETAVLRSLRGKILGGVFPPGSRLPTRMDLEQEFGLGWSPIQRAFNRLKSDGFVKSRGRMGTYVADHPPHLSRFGLLFPARSSVSAFWDALLRAAGQVVQTQARGVDVYHASDGENAEEQKRLEHDILADRLAGVAFMYPAQELSHSPIVTRPGIPRVVLSATHLTDFPSITCDIASFFTRAFQHLAGKSRRRVAHFGARVVPAHFERYASEAGVTTHPHWVHLFSNGSFDSARSVANLLMRAAPENRPDALIISDDNLTEHVMAGLVDAGLRTDQQNLAIVAHFNHPNPRATLLPARWLGFDCREIIGKCIELIDIQRRGLSAPNVTTISPLFDDEMKK